MWRVDRLETRVKPGRKKKPPSEKKEPVCIKLSPWVKAKLKTVNASKTIEEALIKLWDESNGED